jgi:hypothetical protein
MLVRFTVCQIKYMIFEFLVALYLLLPMTAVFETCA